MAEITRLKRIFKYGALDLDDPGREMSPEEVKDFYADIYLELTQANIEGPEFVGDEERYEFRKAVGTKGQKSPLGRGEGGFLTLREAAALEPGPDEDLELMRQVAEAVFPDHENGEAMLPPSEAQGLI